MIVRWSLKITKALAHYVAALWLVILATSVSADGHWSASRDRLADVQGWDELCAIEACEQFPEGYATWAIGPDLFYFPLWQTLKERPPAVYSVQPGRFYETNQDGSVRRSFGYSGSLLFNYCCHYLLTYFGLADSFPDISTGRIERRMPPARVHLRTHDYWPPGRHTINRYLNLEASVMAPPPSFEDVFPNDLSSFNDDFWLIKFVRQNRYGQPSYRIFSKEPLLNGRHVVGYCGSTCGFSTVSFEQDIENLSLHIWIQWLRLAGSTSFSCSLEQDVQICSAPPSVFDEVPELLQRLEALFEAAQIVPSHR